MDPIPHTKIRGDVAGQVSPPSEKIVPTPLPGKVLCWPDNALCSSERIICRAARALYQFMKILYLSKKALCRSERDLYYSWRVFCLSKGLCIGLRGAFAYLGPCLFKDGPVAS